jgi:4-amino-4-deoxy-L-arabinose transferase-like glycosyltransferase
VAVVLWYTTRLTYFDPAEPTITAVSSAFTAGRPLYPALDAAERYAHIYGPVLFLTHAASLRLFGASIVASKVVGALAIIASLGLGFRIFREREGPVAAIVATAGCALVYMAFGNVTFWTRSDPLLILCATVGLYAAHLQKRLPAILVLGVAAGVAMNLKVTGLLYLLPPAALVLLRHGPRALVVSGVCALLTAAAPFTLSTISLANYWGYLELSAGNGLSTARLRLNLEWAVFLYAPSLGMLLIARRTEAPPERAKRLALALLPAIVVTAIVAAKPGGGPFHLLPFMPALAQAVLGLGVGGRRPLPARSLVVAFGIATVVLAVPRQLVFLRTTAARDLRPAVAYLRAFADAHPGRSIGVGFAGISYLSHARPEIVFRTGDYLLDAPAIQEHRLSGLELPASTMRAIEACRSEYMLIPSGATPFDVPSAYYPLGPSEVFPEEFRATFFKHYIRTAAGDVFDVWTCAR